MDCALSSTTGMPCFAARARIGSISAESPNRWTTTMARVRGVMHAAIWSGSRLNVPGSISANTGRAPSALTALPVAINVNAGTMTSSPAPTPHACSASSSASVPEATPMPYRTPQAWAISCSSAAPCGPSTNCWAVSTSSMAARISGSMVSNCARRSSMGIATGEGRADMVIGDLNTPGGFLKDSRREYVITRQGERASLGPARRERARIALATRGRTRETVAVPRDESIHGRAQPAQGRKARDPAKPRELRQYFEHGQPRIESPQPLSFGSAHVHFTVEIAARIGRLCRYFRVVVIQESQTRAGIVRFHLRLRPSAERTGTVHKYVVRCHLWHRPNQPAHVYYDTGRPGGCVARSRFLRVRLGHRARALLLR